MDETRLLEMLDRYLAGEATPDEAVRVREWLGQDAHRAAAFESLRGLPVSRRDTDAAWLRLRAHLDAVAAASTPARAGPRTHPIAPAMAREEQPGLPWTRRAWLRAAAFAAIVIAAGVLWRSALSRGAADFEVVAVTGPGESATLRLADGSEVTLAPDSRLETVRRFGAETRELRMSGEAWFRVVADAAQPFRVAAGGSVSEVLGTAFSVRTLERGVRVVVAEGRVAVRAREATPSASVIVEAGQVAVLAANGRVALEPGADAAAYLAWLTGRLAFVDAPLSEVLAELERWFDANATADDALLARRVTAQFSRQSLNTVLDALSLAIGAQWQRSGRVVRLTAR